MRRRISRASFSGISGKVHTSEEAAHVPIFLEGQETMADGQLLDAPIPGLLWLRSLIRGQAIVNLSTMTRTYTWPDGNRVGFSITHDAGHLIPPIDQFKSDGKQSPKKVLTSVMKTPDYSHILDRANIMVKTISSWKRSSR